MDDEALRTMLLQRQPKSETLQTRVTKQTRTELRALAARLSEKFGSKVTESDLTRWAVLRLLEDSTSMDVDPVKK